jgi:hypothetical protein
MVTCHLPAMLGLFVSCLRPSENCLLIHTHRSLKIGATAREGCIKKIPSSDRVLLGCKLALLVCVEVLVCFLELLLLVELLVVVFLVIHSF